MVLGDSSLIQSTKQNIFFGSKRLTSSPLSSAAIPLPWRCEKQDGVTFEPRSVDIIRMEFSSLKLHEQLSDSYTTHVAGSPEVWWDHESPSRPWRHGYQGDHRRPDNHVSKAAAALNARRDERTF